MKLLKVWAVALIVFVISACVAESESTDGAKSADCSTDAIKQWAYDNLHDYYLFADQVSVVNPRNYASASTLIDDLRVRPFDRFSHITDTSVSSETFGEGKFFGIGYQWQSDSAGRVIVSAIYDDSPLGRAGTIKRGDEFLAINGFALTDLTEAQYLDFVGTREQPATAAWSFRDSQTDTVKTVSLTPALYEINTVLHSEVIEHPDYSGKVGYLVFDIFLSTSEAELDEAIATFRSAGIKELILDLRYNGGGLVGVATKLASQIAGTSTNGELLMEYRHNSKYAAEYDFSIDFTEEPLNLNLDRLIVLTTEYTASSSEIVINALTPYIDVVTIGSRTNGKPYITFGNDFCGKQMHALQAEGFNASNVSVYGGIAAACGASDDLSRDFGLSKNSAPTEGMLQSAIDFIVSGTCATPRAVQNSGISNDDSQSISIIESFTENQHKIGARWDNGQDR